MSDTKPKALDLFCKAGGATKGLQRAGFHVTGVDIEPQPHYCGDEFIQADALTFDLSGFDFIWASPVCKGNTKLKALWKDREYPDQITPIRRRLMDSGLPYVIENVVGARLVNPITLCGAMFDLRVYRHRHFESNVFLWKPQHPAHVARVANCGRRPKPAQFISVAGHFSDVAFARSAMGIDWMTQDELSQAIPPAYSEFIGGQVMQFIATARAA